jgi:hypothetical protein
MCILIHPFQLHIDLMKPIYPIIGIDAGPFRLGNSPLQI